nr:alkaline phosphatase family protein [Candidatus Sigynarchaeota archaeon]
MAKQAKNNRNVAPFLLILALSIGLSCLVSGTSQYAGSASETGLRRVILFSLDSCNPEYFSAGYLPHLNEFIVSRGFKFKVANTILSSETQAGHTTMLTGAFPNSTGMFGNGLFFEDTGVDTGLVLDPAYRWVPTIFESLHVTNPGVTTAFVSGKWRLGPLLAEDADIVLTSPRSKIPIPRDYEALVGTPVTYMDGDLMDAWVFNALLQVIKKDDPNFVFVNLAQIDWVHHGTGAFNANMDRCLREVDALFASFFEEMRFMGKLDSTLFVFTADHGHDTIRDTFHINEFLEANNITAAMHVEGESAYLWLENIGQKATLLSLLNADPKVAFAIGREDYALYNLDAPRNRTGDVFISCNEGVLIANLPHMNPTMTGSHGGISARDVPMGWVGPACGITRIGYDYEHAVPHIADIVPTIYHLANWTVPATIDGSDLTSLITGPAT